MDSLGDGKLTEGNGNVNFAHNDSQAFDFQCSPSSSSGEQFNGGDADKLRCLQDTVPFDDDLVIEDAIETQVMDLAGETQVLNLAGETQVMDDPDCVETQLLDEICNEVVADSDGEGTDTTEILDDTDDSCAVKSMGRLDDQLSDVENIRQTSFCGDDEKGSSEQSDALINGRRSPGLHVSTAIPVDQGTSGPKPGPVARFTSVRTSSFRAFGLAARRTASEGTSSEPSSVLTDSRSSYQQTIIGLELQIGKEIGQLHDLGRIKVLRNRNKTVRKLFTDNSPAESEGYLYSRDNINGGDDMLESPLCDGKLAGLSYVDSQEPGEALEANALNFVERFISDNCMEFDKGVDRRNSTGGKSKHVSSVKGSQSLAKKVNDKSTGGEVGTFDWDDNREDEGGGDIFCRRKEEFFGCRSHARKSSSLPQKPKGRRLDDTHDNIMVHSDSRLVSHSPEENEKKGQAVKKKLKENLVYQLDEQFNVDTSVKKLKANATNPPEMLDVGTDTQMAAEAMEALFCGKGINDHDGDGVHEDMHSNSKVSQESSLGGEQLSSGKLICLSVGVGVRQYKRTKRIGAKLSKKSSVSFHKCPTNALDDCDMENLVTETQRVISNSEAHFSATESENVHKMPSRLAEQRKEEAAESSQLDKSRRFSERKSVKKRCLQEDIGEFTPVSSRTRQSMAVNQLKRAENAPTACRQERSQPIDIGALVEDIIGDKDVEIYKLSNIKRKRSTRSGQNEQLYPVLTATEGRIDESTCRRRRSFRNFSGQVNKSGNLGAKSGLSVWPQDIGQSISGPKRSRINNGSTYVGSTMKKTEVSASLDGSPKGKSIQSDSACNTPVNCTIPVNDISPICMSDEYLKLSCKKNLSRSFLMKEVSSLTATEPLRMPHLKDVRKRRDLAKVRVLFSHHLDEYVIKQQKKILVRLGISVASSILDATHFVADKFVRTRNMLEAIASGKPVVTRLWLDSVGQVKIYLDEESYILRDTEKEKELGFSMPVSLAYARQRPLLQGRRVVITQNTKPSTETISSLVKAVHGQAVGRTARTALKDDKVPDDLLVLSCEDDYEICVPFLERGAAVYSSELLLSGIVTQKLEYERYRLFEDRVKRTRSTIRMRRDGKFLPVKV